MAKVTYSLGYTLNLGNFESLRVDFGVTDDAKEGESVQEASDRVYEFVAKTLVEKVKEAKAELA